MSDGAAGARGRFNPRAFFLDQSWALFITDAKGVSIDDDSDGNISSGTSRAVKDAGVEEISGLFDQDGNIKSEILERLRDSSHAKFASHIMRESSEIYKSDEKAVEMTEGAVFLNWTDETHILHDAWIVRNLTELQAGRIAERVGIKYWIHNKAFHEGRDRIPIDLNDPPFFGAMAIDKISEDHRKRLEAQGALKKSLALSFEGKPLSRRIVDELLAGDPRFRNSVGMVMTLFVSPGLQAWSKRRWPGADLGERGKRLRTQIAAWDSAGWTMDEMMQKLGFECTVDQLAVAMVLRTKEESE